MADLALGSQAIEMSKEEYFSTIDAFHSEGERIAYQGDFATVKLWTKRAVLRKTARFLLLPLL